MAKTSVAPLHTAPSAKEPPPVASTYELFLSMRDVDIERVEGLTNASSNVHSTILWGISGIGYLMYHAAQADESVGLDQGKLSDVGCLLQDLALMAEQLGKMSETGVMRLREPRSETSRSRA